MKKLLIVFILFLLPSLVNAYDVEKRFIYYNLISKTQEAEVTYGDSKYGGNIVIPETISYDGITYTVTSIGQEAFRDCYSLKSVTIPKTIKKIGYLSFFGCSSLSKVNITDLTSWCKIEYNGYEGVPLHWAHHLFLNDVEIKDLIIPEDVTWVGSYAFYELTELSSVSFHFGITGIGDYSFAGCSTLKNIELPNSIRSICYGAFLKCIGLNTVSIPNSCEAIYADAFYGCRKLSSIVLGSNVFYLGQAAFGNCPDLTKVYCYAETVPRQTEWSVFEGSYVEYATLYVPENSLEDYKANSIWNKFKEILPISSQTIQKCETPKILFYDSTIHFISETDDVEFISEITDADINKFYVSDIPLTATYIISVYATKTGYENSDIAKATLCWVDAEPKSEGIENSIAQISARPIMIQYMDGAIKVTGADDGQLVNVYTLDGTFVGKSISKDGNANINTGLQRSNILLVKVGSKTVKLMCD